jgi:phosphatidylglycerol:prolipoprotein diacylglycerol transferase
VLHIPYEPVIAGRAINIHLIFEYAAFFIAFRYYLFLRRQGPDPISSTNRLSIILGAIIGAFLGSRVMALLESPMVEFSTLSFVKLLNVKTIMGGLFGGLLGVEITKWKLKEKQSSGDLFTLPIIIGIFIGRIGCFLSGINEFTYGKETSFIAGMDLGDGLKRHPLALYELLFLAMLLFVLKKIWLQHKLPSGLLFQFFMLSYFGFRFFIEFIKPNTFFLFGLSSIQWLCILCFLYYRKTIITIFKNAYP